MHTDSQIALLVHSCDRYEFLYKGFEIFFSKYWDLKIEANYYFATEEKNVSIENFTNIHSGKGEWADRLKFLLEEKIPEDYILYFQEDMWLNKKVNANFFNQLFEKAIHSKWQQVKLHSAAVYQTNTTGDFIEGFDLTVLDNKDSDFLMSHQVTLWNKEFLLKQLKKKEHPWRNERKGTKRLKALNPKIIHVDYFAENGQKEINNNNNPVLRSEYQTVSMNGLLNDNVQPFIEELLKDDPGHHAYAHQLKYNYDHHLTHDGKPKPRKVDIFKKTKNWLKSK